MHTVVPIQSFFSLSSCFHFFCCARCAWFMFRQSARTSKLFSFHFFPIFHIFSLSLFLSRMGCGRNIAESERISRRDILHIFNERQTKVVLFIGDLRLMAFACGTRFSHKLNHRKWLCHIHIVCEMRSTVCAPNFTAEPWTHCRIMK